MKRKLYIGYLSKQVVGRGARKRVCRGSSPLRKGEGIHILSGSESEEEGASVGEGGRAAGEKTRASAEGRAKRCEQHEPWHGENEGRQDICDGCEDGEERRKNPREEWSGNDSCEGRYPDFEEGYRRRTKIPYNLDPKNFMGEFSPIRAEEDVDEEEEVQEVIEISNDDEKDKISRPREERRPPANRPRGGSFRWEDEFGPTPSHWFEQWLSVIKHDWIIKVREFMEAGVAVTPLDFYNEKELQEIAKRKREILASGLGVKKPAERQDGQGTERDETRDSNKDYMLSALNNNCAFLLQIWDDKACRV
ncbi:hypothetical protein CBR_g4719 [Chara braunii]|uniref:Uncharacterized protein n=1 Tax=Chara braunii TaxID=69332 RepID=A0A388KIK8_CHABU|nr:hypothetical protein CBR_g4719 [Chara braunii]|eukprot:GBG69891.1 hypothetical protein CBR_g4719 [Chara braunii]